MGYFFHFSSLYPATYIELYMYYAIYISYLDFKAALALPKMARSVQTHKSISFIWIVWSTLYVYLCYFLRLGIACLSTGTNWELCSFVVQPNLLEEFGPVSVLMRLRAKMMAQSKESPILDVLLTMEFLFRPINWLKLERITKIQRSSKKNLPIQGKVAIFFWNIEVKVKNDKI